MKDHQIQVRVRYSETDQMGVVYHGNYIPFFEMGRVEWLRNKGVSYKSMEERCSNICYSIINNHAFIDGNKRIGLYVMLILLEYNGTKLYYTQTELINLGLGVAKGELEQINILEWIKSHKKS